MNAMSKLHAEVAGSPGFASDAERWRAVRARDPAADGAFFCCVATTGVFCHPSCSARHARPENVTFRTTRAEAERAGFRACKRCRPDLPPRAAREAALVASACRAIEAAEAEPSLAELAASAGLSMGHFHRLFRRVAGVTPKAYAASLRQARVQRNLSQGTGVTETIYESGFASSGRFYEAADGMLGMTPTAWRAGGAGEQVWHALGDSTLGVVLVAATTRGICAIMLGDDGAELHADLRQRFPRATLTSSEPEFADQVRRVVALVDRPAEAGAVSLPLDIRGTTFQRRVWEALRAIPVGQTRSYAEVAASIGAPRAVRAVAAACAANKLAVAIPCHRVVASAGGLSGYRWGVARKRALLERESGR